MNSRLLLKEKSREKVVYYYSVDRAGAPSDGEIECNLNTEQFRTIKTATGDINGAHAAWLRQPMWTVIFREGCPVKRFVATG